jgi:hypothetical protein
MAAWGKSRRRARSSARRSLRGHARQRPRGRSENIRSPAGSSNRGRGLARHFDNVERFWLGGAAHKWWRDRVAAGAAPVSQKTLYVIIRDIRGGLLVARKYPTTAERRDWSPAVHLLPTPPGRRGTNKHRCNRARPGATQDYVRRSVQHSIRLQRSAS